MGLVQTTLDGETIGNLTNRKIIEKILNNHRYVGYYSIFPSFYSHFCCGIYSSYIKENNIIIHKYKKNPKIKKFEELINSNEYVYCNEEIVNDINTPQFKNIRNSFNYVNKHYSITVHDIKTISKEELITFIYRWKEQHKHYFRLTYRRDLYLLELKDELLGTVLKDKDKVVGLEINYPTRIPGVCVNILRKHDIDYKNLHDYLRIVGAKYCYKLGYNYCNDESGDAKLKKYKDKFLGKKGYMYKYEVEENEKNN
jgi:hypothetical protein